MALKFTRNIIFFSLIICLGISTLGWKKIAVQTARSDVFLNNTDTAFLIHPEHIIFLWLENKEFNTIINNSDAPFINSLVAKGTLFTNTYAITHPSYPNYVDFFAGQDNGIVSNDCIYNSRLATPNLYNILKATGKSFAWYSEDLPKTGSKVCDNGYYVQKHNPTAAFANVPAIANKRFADFPIDYNQLENVVCISPNLINDMHDGTIKDGDKWTKKHLGALVDWCTTHKSIFVIYFDESETYESNRIPVIAVGQQVKAGCQLDTRYDHYSWTKTISAMFLAPDAWTNNLRKAKQIIGCWKQ